MPMAGMPQNSLSTRISVDRSNGVPTYSEHDDANDPNSRRNNERDRRPCGHIVVGVVDALIIGAAVQRPSPTGHVGAFFMASACTGSHDGGTVKEASQRQPRRTFESAKPIGFSKIIVDVVVPPNAVVEWYVLSNCELTVRHARIWLTRDGSDYDFWLMPNVPALSLRRGERIWLSTDAAVNAEVSLSMAPTSAMQWLMKIGARLFLR